MTIDNVIGNPPYSKGIDLDFTNLSFELCKGYVCFVVPAKWQVTSDDYRGCCSKTIDYRGFRKKFTPHMEQVVFYPDTLDIFEVELNDGVSYFLIDKQRTFEKCTIKNVCLRQKYFNGIAQRSIANRETLVNIGNEIIEYLGDYERYTYEEVPVRKNFYVATTSLFLHSLGSGGSYDWENGGIKKGSGGQGGMLFTKEGNVQALGRSDIHMRSDAVQASKKVTFQSNDIEECQNFISWLYTKFVRFFLLINESQMNNAVKPDWFRFVPSPNKTGGFTHTYTDKMLYEAYNLPEKYIDVIEAVIRSR